MDKKNKTYNLGCRKKIKKTYNLGCRQKKEVVKIPKKKKQISNDTFTYIIYTKADSKKVKKKKKDKKNEYCNMDWNFIYHSSSAS